MRKQHFPAVLTLFLLFSASIIWAQKVSVSGNVYEKGTVKNSFKTPYGAITVVLPDDIRPGDVISGTVNYEPEGQKEKEKNKNRAELLKYGLSVGRQPGTANSAEAMRDVFILTSGQQATMHGGAEHARDIFVTEFAVPADFTGNKLYLQLRDAQKNMVAESGISSIRLRNPPPTNLVVPVRSQDVSRLFIPDKTIYMSGELAVISSSSTAPKHKSGTLVYLNRTRQKELSEQIELKILASSPRQSVFSIPANIYGPAELVFKDANQKTIATEKIHILQLEAFCPKTNLRRGESTLLTVKVMGLEGCPADYLRLSLNNTTASSVQLGRSNHEQLFIEPVTLKYSSISTDYAVQKENEKGNEKNKGWEKSSNTEFSLQRSVTALQTGSFNIDITLNYPSTVYNDPLRQQLNALKTTEQFKNWIQALNNDMAHKPKVILAEPIKDPGLLETSGGIGEGMSDVIAGAAANDLEQARSLAYNYARWLDIPPGAGQVPQPYLNSTLEASKAAVENALSEKGIAPVHYEVIGSALQAITGLPENPGNDQFRSQADSLRDKLLKMQREMNDFNLHLKTFEEILKTFNEIQRSATNNMRASYDPKDYMAEQQALISEILFPEIDTRKVIKVYVGGIYYPSKQMASGEAQVQLRWEKNKFQLEIGSLPCGGIHKIDGFTIKQGIKPGEFVPQQSIQLTIDAADLKSWQDWFKNQEPLDARINYSNNSGETYFTIELKQAKAVSLSPVNNGEFKVELSSAKSTLNYSEDILRQVMNVTDPGHVLRPDDLVAVFNPFSKKLKYDPQYKDQLFEKMNLRLRTDGRYDANLMSFDRKMYSAVIDLVPGSNFDLINESKDSIKYDEYGFESTGELITEKWGEASYRFYKNAKCMQWKEAMKGECIEDYLRDSEGKLVKNEKGELVKSGKSSRIETTGESHCYKGTEFCTEMYIVAIIEYLYDDANCKRLVKVKTLGGWSCQ